MAATSGRIRDRVPKSESKGKQIGGERAGGERVVTRRVGQRIDGGNACACDSCFVGEREWVCACMLQSESHERVCGREYTQDRVLLPTHTTHT